MHLLIIDAQNGFTVKPHLKPIVQNIEQLVALRLFDQILTSRFINAPNSPFEQYLHWTKLRNEPEITLGSAVIEQQQTFSFTKNGYSCVTPELLNQLEQDGQLPRYLYVCGFDTDCCVLATAIALFEIGICPIILSHYCHSNGDEESHKAALICLQRLIGKLHIVDSPITKKSDLRFV